VENLDDRFRLFASHHYWRSNDRCVGIRVSVTEATRAAFLNGTAPVRWRTLYESHPCLPVGELRFSQSGGRMVMLDDTTLLLTIGDHSLDGFYARTSVPQDPDSQYGKTVRIDVQSGTSTVYSLGHRNAQGLYKSPDGKLWLTEQGPEGGDELNLLAEGANFGWPIVTYGAAYGRQTWPANAHDGHHDRYVAPVFAWVPSIAVTSILGIQSDRVPAWQGDLLVASLRGHIIRLRIDGERVVFAEPIYSTGTRIRDMTEIHDGRIAIFQDGGSISFIVPVPARTDGDPEPARSQPTSW
jgi:glucose/arabinose dehydrogenase